MLAVVLRAECAALQVGAFRKRLEKVVGDKHEEVMGRMGAIMATGAPARPLHPAHPPCMPVWRSKNNGRGRHMGYAHAIVLAGAAVLSGKAVLRALRCRRRSAGRGRAQCDGGPAQRERLLPAHQLRGHDALSAVLVLVPAVLLPLPGAAAQRPHRPQRRPQAPQDAGAAAANCLLHSTAFPIQVAPQLSAGIRALEQVVSVLWDNLVRHSRIDGLG